VPPPVSPGMDGQQMQFRMIDMPERKADVPRPRITTARRVELPDGAHWIEVVGGYSHEERRFWAWLMERTRGASDIADDAEREQIENDVNAYVATFMDVHIVAHNLTYPGTDDELPDSGWDLFWELPFDQSFRLCSVILNPPSPFDSPKAAPNSTSG